MFPFVTRLAVAAFFLSGPLCQAADLVEFMNGKTLSGKILQIRKPDGEFDFQSKIGSSTIDRTYSYSDVHAVTFNGKRFVLTDKNGSPASNAAGDQPLTPAEVKDLIDRVGSSDPAWLEATALNHPKTLDLSWPIQAEGPWNESKNIGQFMWGRVNPNVSRWKSGMKLVYACIDLHKGDQEKLERDYLKLGEMYFSLFQDYPRAAYWLIKGKASLSREVGVHLAESYYRLGDKKRALSMLRQGTPHFAAIKVLGDMGAIHQARKLTAAYAETNFFNEALLAMGDAYRNAGKFDLAIEQYQTLLDRNKARNAEYKKRFHARALSSIESINLYEKISISDLKNGTYSGTAIGYNGAIKVRVDVSGGALSKVHVVSHKEKQFYAAISDTTSQLVQKQSVQGIDGTSGATITSEAIVAATARALAGNPQ